jgi:hypothetical protein
VTLNEQTQQSGLVISKPGEPTITVDHLEVVQFIYLLLDNEKIREVIDTITSKAVLILGRFTSERKAVLDAIRNELHHRAPLGARRSMVGGHTSGHHTTSRLCDPRGIGAYAGTPGNLPPLSVMASFGPAARSRGV